MVIRHVKDRLVRERVDMDILRGHESDHVEDLDGPFFTCKLLLKPLDQGLRLVCRDGLNERGVVDTRDHISFRGHANCNGKDNFIFEIGLGLGGQAVGCLFSDQFENRLGWACGSSLSFTRGIEYLIQLGDRNRRLICSPVQHGRKQDERRVVFAGRHFHQVA